MGSYTLSILSQVNPRCVLLAKTDIKNTYNTINTNPPPPSTTITHMYVLPQTYTLIYLRQLETVGNVRSKKQRTENRWVLSCDLKVDKVWACYTEKLSQIKGPVEKNVRCPCNILSLFKIWKMWSSAEKERVCDGGVVSTKHCANYPLTKCKIPVWTSPNPFPTRSFSNKTPSPPCSLGKSNF